MRHCSHQEFTASPREGCFYRDDSTLARLAYWISPNLAFLWVTDALTQENRITLHYVGLASGYAGLIVLCWLSLGVALFQKREVG